MRRRGQTELDVLAEDCLVFLATFRSASAPSHMARLTEDGREAVLGSLRDAAAALEAADAMLTEPDAEFIEGGKTA